MTEFRIAISTQGPGFNFISDKSKVTEALFYQTLENKVKEITKENPEKFEETLIKVKEHLLKKSVTVIDTWFEIKSK